MSHNSDSDGDWIPLPRQGDLPYPSKLKPEDTTGPPGKIQRKLSEKGWALVDEASHESELKKSKLKLNQEILGPVRNYAMDTENTALHALPVSEIELLSLQSEESEGKGPRGTPRSIAVPAMKDQDDKFQELEASIKSLNFRMEAIQVNINELQKQFQGLDVLLAAQGLVRSTYHNRGFRV
jgi:hypothetical protein